MKKTEIQWGEVKMRFKRKTIPARLGKQYLELQKDTQFQQIRNGIVC